MKIFIDPGHGGSDPGAVSKIKESDYTLSYALELGKALTVLGFSVDYSRTTNNTVSLSQRSVLANSWPESYFISLHFNAGGGTGVETFALSPGGQGEKLAKAVQSSIIEATGMTDRGVKFANFQVLRETSMPAILIEGGFADTGDALRIQTEDYKQKFIQGITKGICDITGIAWVNPYTVPSTPVISSSVTSTTDKDGYLMVRVLDSKTAALRSKIREMGYACEPVILP